MAKGAKQKGKVKNAEEPKASKAPSQAVRKANNNSPAARAQGSDGDDAAGRAGRNGGFLAPPGPEPMTRHDSTEEDYGAWGGGGGGGGPPGGWGSGGDGWGETTNSASWDMSQNQIIKERTTSRSPAAIPPNNTGYGRPAPSRHSPSIVGETYTEARDSFEYESDHHDRGWDPPEGNRQPPANAPAPSALPTPTIRRLSEMATPAPTGVSALAAAEAAFAEQEPNPAVKYSSASAAAKKAEAGNPHHSNRDSIWSKTHEMAAKKLVDPHATFKPDKRASQQGPAAGKTNGPHVSALWDETHPLYSRAPPMHEMQHQPAWMTWGGGQEARIKRRQAQEEEKRAAAQKHKKGASWQNWKKMASAHPSQQPKYGPPSDESSDEEEWEDEDEWAHYGRGRQGNGMAHRGGRGGFAGSHMGGHGRGRASSGAWPDPGGGSSAWGNGGDGGWGASATWGDDEWGNPSKVTNVQPPENAAGSRNVLSPKQRTQIYNELLMADLAQKPKHAGNPRHSGQKGGWGMGGMDDWDAHRMQNGVKTKHKNDSAAAWGAWDAPEDDWSRGQQKGKPSKTAGGDGWGTTGGGGGWGDDGGYGWGGKGKPKNDGWGNNGDGWGVQDDADDEDDGWGPNPGEKSWGGWQEESTGKHGNGGWGDGGFTDEDNNKVRFAGGGGGVWGHHPAAHSSMVSKTMAMANGSHGMPGAAMHNAQSTKPLPQDVSNIRFLESDMAAFHGVNKAFFDIGSRPPRDRFHWMFSPDKDPNVASMLSWIQTVSYGLGALGFHKFIQTRERGALFINVKFRLPSFPNQPVLDWVNFDVLQKTMDKTLQESVAFYDPAQIVIVFVYLPSESGRSVAIWRRKIPVPGNVRVMFQKELAIVKKGLRPEKDYVLFVDHIPKKKPKDPNKRSSKLPNSAQDRTPSVANPKGKLLTKQLQAQLQAQQPSLGTQGKGPKVKPEKKKKRRWWQFWKSKDPKPKTAPAKADVPMDYRLAARY